MSDCDDLRAKALAVDLETMRWLSVAAMRAEGKSEEDAEYLAAVSPDVVLELLEHHELALAELSLFHGLYDKVVARAEAAEAAVERVRALVRLGWRVNRGYEHETTTQAFAAGRNGVIDAVRDALDGPGAAASVEVDSGSTSDANGAQIGSEGSRMTPPLRSDARKRLLNKTTGQAVPRTGRAKQMITKHDEGASGAREGGTA